MQNSTKTLKKSEIQLFNRENNFGDFDEKIEIRDGSHENLMASRFLVFFLFGVVLARPFFPHFSNMDSKTVQRRTKP